MKSELGLSATSFWLAVSAFFWVYAPVQLFAGWLCDRFSVYKLMAAGILALGGKHLPDGLRRRLRCRCSCCGSCSASARASPFPAARRSSPATSRPNGAASPMRRSPPGIALGPAAGTLAGGLIVASLGLAGDVLRLRHCDPALAAALAARSCACRRPAASRRRRARFRSAPLLGKWPLWSMSIVHCLGNYCFYFLLAWLPLFLTKSRGFTIARDDLAGDARLCGAGRLRARLRPFLRLVDPLGPVGSGVPALDDGRQPVARRRRHPRPRLRRTARSTIGILLCLAGAASASLSMNLYAVAQMFAGRARPGHWVGFQNALGNLSGIFGPIVTGMIVDRAGYTSAFVLTAAVAAFGGVLVGVRRSPESREDRTARQRMVTVNGRPVLRRRLSAF